MREDFVIIENKKYIPLRVAAKLSGYAKDYLGQLSRGGYIDAKRLGRAWFVSEDSVLAYKSGLRQLSFEKGVKTEIGQSAAQTRPSQPKDAAVQESFTEKRAGVHPPAFPERIGIISRADTEAIKKASIKSEASFWLLSRKLGGAVSQAAFYLASRTFYIFVSSKKRLKIKESRIFATPKTQEILADSASFAKKFFLKKRAYLIARRHFLLSRQFRSIFVVFLIFFIGFWIGDTRDFLGNAALKGIAKAREINFHTVFQEPGGGIKDFFAQRWRERTGEARNMLKIMESRTSVSVREFDFDDYRKIGDIFVENIGGFVLRNYNNVSYIRENASEIIGSRAISYMRDSDKFWDFYAFKEGDAFYSSAASVEGGDKFLNVFSSGLKYVIPRIAANYDFYLHDVADYIRSLFAPDVSNTEFAQNYQVEFDALRGEFEILKKSGFTIERIITEPNLIERTILREIAGLSQADLDNRVNILRNEIFQEIARLNQLLSNQVDSNTRIVQLTQVIHELESVTLTNVTVNGVIGLTDADIPNDITISGYLPLAGGTLTGDLFLTNPARIGVGTTSPFADISAAGLIAGDYLYIASTTATSTFNAGIQVASLNVTSATATSTFANGIQIASGCFRLPDGSCAGTGGGSGSGTVNAGTLNTLAYYTGATEVSSADFLFVSAAGQVLGIGTSTPNANAIVTIGATSTASIPLALKLQTGQIADAFQIQDSASSTLFSIDSSGRLEGFVSNSSSTIDSAFNVSGLFQASSTILAGGGTSTFYGGIVSQGLQITNGAGAIESASAGTSTFANGIDINTGVGCFAINGACISGGSGAGSVNAGTQDRLAYYSSSANIDPASFLAIDTTNSIFDISASINIYGEIASLGSGIGTSTLFAATSALGIGTSTPDANAVLTVG
ncbi:MAG: hypothetical protein COU47_03045, partial [Candidatus Niyogibacteria bacterium CG10_big_fil_rev_8_21_14_0_10_46_36]